MLYQKLLKPIFFRFDPERVHNAVTFYGEALGKCWLTRKLISLFLNYKNPKLTQTIHGITFFNPLGLSAGFDKDARLMRIMPTIGFGFEEIGSITGEPCIGNPRPRLWRLPQHKSIVVYYGLKNPGCEAVARKLAGKKFAFPLGISVAKTNCRETVDIEAGIRDYLKAFQTLEPYADYLTINISCPNAYGGEPFTDAERLELLLKEIDKIKTKKPVFLKVSPDLSKEEVDKLLRVTQKHNVQGWIISNLTKIREGSGVSPEELSKVGSGGLSGKLVEKRANEMISYVYKRTDGKLTIIGVGGIFTAEDAYEKIKSGASLLQMITGMIFEGPQVVRKINKGLVKLLEQDGYENIAGAVGKYHS